MLCRGFLRHRWCCFSVPQTSLIHMWQRGFKPCIVKTYCPFKETLFYREEKKWDKNPWTIKSKKITSQIKPELPQKPLIRVSLRIWWQIRIKFWARPRSLYGAFYDHPEAKNLVLVTFKVSWFNRYHPPFLGDDSATRTSGRDDVPHLLYGQHSSPGRQVGRHFECCFILYSYIDNVLDSWLQEVLMEWLRRVTMRHSWSSN